MIGTHAQPGTSARRALAAIAVVVVAAVAARPADTGAAAVPAGSNAGATTGDGPRAIDALLDEGRSALALVACERVARDPGERALSRFLHQYGRALAAEERPEDAAVMFLRSAILFETSAFAAPSLIEAARIYRDVYDDPAASRRLLRLAVNAGTLRRQADVVSRARRLLASEPTGDAP